MTTTPAELLAAEDSHGAPYQVPRHWYGVSYEMALAVARSAHPSRVLANTNGYRYGKFTEYWEGPDRVVRVHMMDSHIATFRPDGVELSSCGYVTISTTEALSELVTGGWFYTTGGQLMFEPYDRPAGTRDPQPFTDGRVFTYGSNACQECGCAS